MALGGALNEIYDIARSEWNEICPLKYERMLPFCVNVSVDKCLVLGGSNNGKMVKPIEIYDAGLNGFYVPRSKVILPSDIKKIFGVFYVGKEIYEEVDYKPMDTDMFYELNANIYNVRSSFNSIVYQD